MEMIVVVLLFIIAMAVAPWFIAILAGLAAVYGLIWLVAVAIGFVFVIPYVFWKAHAAQRKRDEVIEIYGPRKACPSCQYEVPETAALCMHCGALC